MIASRFDSALRLCNLKHRLRKREQCCACLREGPYVDQIKTNPSHWLFNFWHELLSSLWLFLALNWFWRNYLYLDSFINWIQNILYLGEYRGAELVQWNLCRGGPDERWYRFFSFSGYLNYQKSTCGSQGNLFVLSSHRITPESKCHLTIQLVCSLLLRLGLGRWDRLEGARDKRALNRDGRSRLGLVKAGASRLWCQEAPNPMRCRGRESKQIGEH